MMDILNTFGNDAIKLIVWVIFAILGWGLKKIVTRILNTKEKRELAYDVVTFVEQKYKDLHGEQKFNEAVKAFTEILAERGIETSTTEIMTLVESAVGAFNDTFNKTE